MRNYKHAGALFLFALSLFIQERDANAAFIFNIDQVGVSVVVTGSGTLNTSGLGSPSSGSSNGTILPDIAFLYVGPNTFQPFIDYGGISGPAELGPGDYPLPPTNGSGDFVGVAAGSTLAVPAGYVSGSQLSDTDTYFEDTIAKLGLTTGQYVYAWGSGLTADSLTINIGVVPEPASVAVAAIPTVALLRRRQRRLSI